MISHENCEASSHIWQKILSMSSLLYASFLWNYKVFLYFFLSPFFCLVLFCFVFSIADELCSEEPGMDSVSKCTESFEHTALRGNASSTPTQCHRYSSTLHKMQCIPLQLRLQDFNARWRLPSEWTNCSCHKRAWMGSWTRLLPNIWCQFRNLDWRWQWLYGNKRPAERCWICGC